MGGLPAAFFEALFERQGDAVIVADDDTRIVRVNQAACDMLGRRREELEGLTVGDLIVADHPHETQRLWGQFRQDRQQRGRIVLRRGDGTEVSAEYVATAAVGDGLHASVLRDDLARRRDELLIRLMLDTTAAIETTLDPVEIMTRVARAVVSHVADWAAADLLKPDGRVERAALAHRGGGGEQRAWELWEGRSQSLGPASERALETGTPHEVEISEDLIEGLFAEPELREAVRELGIRRALVVPVPSRRIGRPHGLLTLGQAESDRPVYEGLRRAAQDLAQRVGDALDKAKAYEDLRHAYERAEEQRRVLDAIMTHVPEGISIAEGPDLRLRTVSRFGAESLGVEPDQILGTTSAERPGVLNIIDPSTGRPRDPTTLPLQRAVESGEPVVDEPLVVERPDGYRIELLANASPIRDARGRITGGILAWRDVTSLMDAERKRDEALRGEREARQSAEAASRLKDQFLGTVSHELRTPLNAILGWAQILREDGVSRSELEQGLAVIERNARAQKELVDDLLDVSRIVSGNIRLNMEPVQLDSLLAEVLTSIEPTAEERGVTVSLHIDPAVPPVVGDASRLQQVVSNLLSNAIKFSREGGHVDVRLELAKSHARLTVRDDGSGIEPEALERIFHRFRQADGGSTRRHGGLGLGLAIVKELVEQHGGTVAAHSDGAGRGARFVVELPIRPLAPRGLELPREPSLIPAQPKLADLAGLRILLVEDDPDSRVLIARVLARAGAQVDQASSAHDALRTLHRGTPDVIVSDIGMPTMDGLTLMRRIRGMDLSEQPPAIALTAYASPRDRAAALEAGYQQHLAKPVEATTLTSAVRELASDGD